MADGEIAELHEEDHVAFGLLGLMAFVIGGEAGKEDVFDLVFAGAAQDLEFARNAPMLLYWGVRG